MVSRRLSKPYTLRLLRAPVESIHAHAHAHVHAQATCTCTCHTCLTGRNIQVCVNYGMGEELILYAVTGLLFFDGQWSATRDLPLVAALVDAVSSTPRVIYNNLYPVERNGRTITYNSQHTRTQSQSI